MNCTNVHELTFGHELPCGALTEEEYKNMFAKCSKMRKLLISSITTAKAGE